MTAQAELAYGACNPNFGSWGDRFIQLGDWRIAAFGDHLSFSHKNGQTAVIFRGRDGTVHNGPRTDYNSWNRPLGFPHGITFGPGFIQIGEFRLGAFDDDHFSVGHQNGLTVMTMRSDGTEWYAVDFNNWKRSAGPAGGITFGDEFIQFGKFRLGTITSPYLILTHSNGKSMIAYQSDGSQHPDIFHSWAPRVNHRYAQWHCGSIQDILGFV